jgi:hypothetical protein
MDRKKHENLSPDSGHPDGDSNRLLPEYKPDALLLEPTSSALGLHQIILKSKHKFAFISINLIGLFSFFSQLKLLFCALRRYKNIVA